MKHTVQARRRATSSPLSPSPQRLLDWTFQRGSQVLSCALLANRSGDYTVTIGARGATTSASAERLSGVAAFQRHAALAMQLRQQGWTVVAYASIPTPRTPAPQAHPLAA